MFFPSYDHRWKAQVREIQEKQLSQQHEAALRDSSVIEGAEHRPSTSRLAAAKSPVSSLYFCDLL